MGEKVDIRQFEQARSIIGHDVDGPREIEDRAVVAVKALVKGLEP